LSHNKELVAKEGPDDRELEVGFDQDRGGGFFAGHGVGEKAGVGVEDFKMAVFEGFAKGAFGEWDVVVPEIPVGAGDTADVWPHGDEAAAGAEGVVDLVECEGEGGFVGEVFEKIAGEDDVEVLGFGWPGAGAVLVEEGDGGMEVPGGVWVEVHGEAFFGGDGVDEFAVAAAEVEDGGIGGNVSGEEMGDEYVPDFFAVFEVGLEALGVDAAEVALVVGREGIDGVFGRGHGCVFFR
jgi:hypothetical protein